MAIATDRAGGGGDVAHQTKFDSTTTTYLSTSPPRTVSGAPTLGPQPTRRPFHIAQMRQIVQIFAPTHNYRTS